MNYLWAGMVLLGIVYGAVTGRMGEVSQAAFTSAKEAVSLAVTMLGVMGLWSGLMEIAADSGIPERVSEKMRPLLRFLFPGIPKEHPALKEITVNIIANVLGLGWAATPAGLKAMEQLEELEQERRRGKEKRAVSPGTASDEMCTFLIINISSLQLIPVNMIAYRSQYGSVNPAAVVGPAIAATAVSTLVAIVFCRLMNR